MVADMIAQQSRLVSEQQALKKKLKVVDVRTTLQRCVEIDKDLLLRSCSSSCGGVGTAALRNTDLVAICNPPAACMPSLMFL